MRKRILLHLSAKLVFVGAAFGVGLAMLELATNVFGASLIDNTYSPGRILELSSTLLTYVIAVLIWEVLAELRVK